MKASADIFDVMGLHAVIVYLMAGKSEVRFLAVGLGWAFAHSNGSIAMAALVWLFTRNDLRSGMRRIVALLIALCVFREFIEQ
ncbi:unnamed protein product [Onchocerca flexuosa]|uniref:BOS complex subunit TMEM147 n=1 Tax=Onchocerca flexuosa TaxID=387005 RepID=A0A183I6N1_9BILA|nr:unnamed protein product [Onchocerca flexuosa]